MSYLYSTRQRGTDTQGHGFEKKTIEEKLSDFERKGNHWLELMRNWIIEANQAENLSKQENPSRMRDFLVSIGSN
ncbi:MAG: hypothetical protein AAB489_05140, partial [Patescibacteria group bacterium]